MYTQILPPVTNARNAIPNKIPTSFSSFVFTFVLLCTVLCGFKPAVVLSSFPPSGFPLPDVLSSGFIGVAFFGSTTTLLLMDVLFPAKSVTS